MDNHSQVTIICSICGNKPGYNNYRRINNPRKICAAKNPAQYYQANKNKITARSILYLENTKYFRNSHTQQMEEL